jgi:hypothetical protein
LLELNPKTNIVLICCVSPHPKCFEHSLPAIKFCGRIRDCIVKRLRKGDAENVSANNVAQLSERSGMAAVEKSVHSTRLEEIKSIIEQIRVESRLKRVHVRYEVPESVRTYTTWCNEQLYSLNRLLTKFNNVKINNSTYQG